MDIKKVEYTGGYYNIDQIPRFDLPEIVIAGRSNVGKSSFINTITKRKKIANVSKKPGKTRLINYFKVNNNFFLVDLPGYGYAKRSKKEIKHWKNLINNYFQNSLNIKFVTVLIDSKIGITKLDHDLIEYLINMQYPLYIIATKSDKLNQSKKIKSKRSIEKYFNPDEYHFFSSLKKTGVNEYYKLLDSILN